MENSVAEQIFNAIVHDNVKDFEKCIQSDANLKIRFGRFPLLSVLYLFKSYSILNKFENKLFKIKDFEEQFEPFEIYQKFKKYAGRSLRFLLEQELVSPLEVLAIMDERSLIVQIYGQIYKSDKIIASVKNIYLTNYGLSFCCNNTSTAYIDRKPLTRGQRLSVSICCVILAALMLLNTICILLVAALNGLGSAGSPIRIDSAREFTDALAGNRSYVLTSDIFLSEPFTSKEFSGTIDGAGHSVIVENGSCLTENLSGEIKNLNLIYNSVTLELQSSEALFAKSVSGKITSCKVTGLANLTFNGTNIDTFFSVFAANNEGTIYNCESNVSITAVNVGEFNSYVSAFAGENYGTIELCTNSGDFISDTVDLAGIAAYNLMTIKNCKNIANIEQESEKEWNPNCAGIVMENYGEIIGCENHGDICARQNLDIVSEYAPSLYCCGIACTNYTIIDNCKNYGKISAQSKVADIFCGGIVGLNTCLYVSAMSYSMGTVQNCYIFARCEATTESASMYCGGGVGFNAGQIVNSKFVGELHINSQQRGITYAGGICGYNGICEIRRDSSLVHLDSSTGGVNSFVVGFIVNCEADVTFKTEIDSPGSDTIFAGIAVAFVLNNQGNGYEEFVKSCLKSNRAIRNDTYDVLVEGRVGNGAYLDVSAYCAEFVPSLD